MRMMNRRSFLAAAGLGTAALALPRALVRAAAERVRKPNFLFIVADDLATGDLGCYGGTNVPTPNIDRLARESLLFTHHFVSMAMCSPMRGALYTGLYPVRNGIHLNHGACRPGTKSVVHRLRPLGYRVGLAGKGHVKPAGVFPFDHVPGFEPQCSKAQATHDVAGVRDYLKRDPDQPFCLFVCSIHPHAPWTLGDASVFDPAKLSLPPHWVDTPETRQDYSRYLAEVALLDRQVGELLQVLDETGHRDDTVVFFCGEQGPQFPCAKWTCYHQGQHSALLARWPGRIKPGVTAAMTQYEDILPTLMDLAGATPPAAELDGRSFAAVMREGKKEHRDLVYGLHNNVPEGPPYPIRSVRNRHYKLILNLEPEREYHEKHVMGPDEKRWHTYWGSWKREAERNPLAAKWVNRYLKRPPVELFDCEKDPWELENLADRPELKAVRDELEKELRAWMKAQNDPGAELDREAPLPPPAAPRR